MDSSWRAKARPIIDRVLRSTEGQEERLIRKALRDAYPFGERQWHPYKMWCAEVKSQRTAWAHRNNELQMVSGPLFPESEALCQSK